MVVVAGWLFRSPSQGLRRPLLSRHVLPALRQLRALGARLQAPRADGMHAGQRHVLTPAPQKLRHRQRQSMLLWLPVGIELTMIAIAERHLLAVKRHEAVILDRPAPHVAGQIRHHAPAMGIPFGNVNIPLLPCCLLPRARAARHPQSSGAAR